MKYYPAQVCLNGHVFTENANIPENCKDICPKCNAKTITKCPNCKADILRMAISGNSFGFYNKPPSHCHKCKQPYPWAKTHNLDSWEAFEDAVGQIKKKTEGLKKSTGASTTTVLFRGQPNAKWGLKSTLERKTKKEITVGIYFNLMLKVWRNPVIKNKREWPDLEEKIENLNVDIVNSFLTAKANSDQIISFMAHLRHHGFPSPLLDWTECSLIAAFFAFTNIPNNAKRVAIYTFREHTGDVTSEYLHGMSKPTTIEVGSHFNQIERHKKQKANYTLCVQQDNIKDFKNARFVDMEKDVNRPGVYTDSKGNDVDMGSVENVTNKYTIPVSERNKVLKKLQTEGINRCSLFQDETEDSQLFDYWNIILANEEI